MAIYIISGFPRSGTSMMMACLEAGGMEVARSDKRDALNRKISDESYKMNPDSLNELAMPDIRDPWFLAKHAGKAVKIVSLFVPMVRIPPGTRFKAIYMWRDPEEIRQSAQAIGMQIPLDRVELVQQAAEQELRERGGQVTGLEYMDVIKAPEICFRILARNGWPIDAEKAAQNVNPELYRFRRDRLTDGIQTNGSGIPIYNPPLQG